MKIYEITDKSTIPVPELLQVWEASVRTTHLFLAEPEIVKIRNYVPQAIANVSHLIVAENPAGDPIAFMGITENRLEMLFLAPEERGKGLGKTLLGLGIRRYGVNEITVNEQNPQAVGFYKHLGFRTYRRTDLDEEGNPYPLLYMKLSDS